MAKKRTGKRKLAPTREAGAKKTAAPATDKPKQGLNYKAALKAAQAGRTLRNIARAAGSQAKSAKSQRVMGWKIVQLLRDKGLLFETFNRLGYPLERFAQEVIDETQAMKRTRVTFEGRTTEEYEDPDFASRRAAREQYMVAVGIKELPARTDGERDTLEDLPDDLIERIARGECSDEELEAVRARLGGPTAAG